MHFTLYKRASIWETVVPNVSVLFETCNSEHVSTVLRLYVNIYDIFVSYLKYNETHIVNNRIIIS